MAGALDRLIFGSCKAIIRQKLEQKSLKDRVEKRKRLPLNTSPPLCTSNFCVTYINRLCYTYICRAYVNNHMDQAKPKQGLCRFLALSTVPFLCTHHQVYTPLSPNHILSHPFPVYQLQRHTHRQICGCGRLIFCS